MLMGAKRGLWAGLLISASWPQIGHAQTAAGGQAGEPPAAPGDIIVTAQKRSESINRVPLSITAASGAQLAQAGVKDAGDLAKLVTGFTAVQSRIGSPVYYIRGIGYDDFSLSARPSVTLYADEAPLPYSVMTLGAALDLERVEVLKGPQGLLFGANSTGGAINFVAAKPTSTLSYGFDGSFGRFNENTEGGFVSGPLADGVKARLAVQHDGRDAWQYDYVNGAKIGKKDVTSGRLTVEAEPTDTLRVALTLSGALDKSDPQMPQFIGYDPNSVYTPAVKTYPTAPRNARATSFDPSGVYGKPLAHDNYQWQAALRADWDLASDLTLTSLTAYGQNKQDYATDSDGTELTLTEFNIDGKIKAFSQELRLAGRVGSHLKWVAGGNFEDDRTQEVNVYDVVQDSSGNIFNTLGLPPTDNTPIVMNTKFNSKAVFGNVDYELGDRITLHGGARYTATKTRFNGCSEFGLPPGGYSTGTGLFLLTGIPLSNVGTGRCFTIDLSGPTPAPIRVNDTLSEHNVSWRGGIDFKPMRGTLLYASVSRGYKAGAYSNIAVAFSIQLEPVKQESVTAYEAGVKSDIIANLLHVNAAFFYYDYSNKQLQGTRVVVPLGNLQSLVSVPKSRVQGAEFEATLRPVRGLTLGGMMTYVDSKVTSHFQGTTQFGATIDLKGTSFPKTPKWQAGANAEYRTALSGDWDGYVGGNLTYRSKSNGDFVADDRLKIDGYSVVDARIGAQSRDGRWLVELFGRNIFNTYYWTNAIRPNDSIIRYAGMPATYGARMSYRFR